MAAKRWKRTMKTEAQQRREKLQTLARMREELVRRGVMVAHIALRPPDIRH